MKTASLVRQQGQHDSMVDHRDSDCNLVGCAMQNTQRPKMVADRLVPPEHSHRWLQVQRICIPEDQYYDPQRSSLRKGLESVPAMGCLCMFSWVCLGGRLFSGMPGVFTEWKGGTECRAAFIEFIFALQLPPFRDRVQPYLPVATAVCGGLYRFSGHGVQHW